MTPIGTDSVMGSQQSRLKEPSRSKISRALQKDLVELNKKDRKPRVEPDPIPDKWDYSGYRSLKETRAINAKITMAHEEE